MSNVKSTLELEDNSDHSPQRNVSGPSSEGATTAAPYERNVSTFIAGTIGREIVSGTLPPGTLLPGTEETCARFSASRTALREAYSILSAKALIIAKPKVGTRVRPKADWNMFDPDVLAWHIQSAPSQKFLADLYVLREMVEPVAAYKAAALCSPATTTRLSEAYDRMQRFKDGSGDLIDADLQFHTAILEATTNPFLTALAGFIKASLQCTFRYSWEGAARMHDSRLLQHGAILEAIREGSPELAEDRMRTLLRDSLGDVKKYFDLQGRKTAKRTKR